MSNIYDAHGHLDHLIKKEKNINLDEALSHHELFIESTVDYNNLIESLSLLKNSKIKYILGAHPENVDKAFDTQEYITQLSNNNDFIDELIEKNILIGVGEIGLDYHYTDDKIVLKKQEELFRSMIEYAISKNLAIQVHSRDCFNETLSIIKEYPELKNKFIIHCFTHGLEEALQVIDAGGYLSYGGVTTFNSAKNVLEAFKSVDIDKVFLETDLPYLAPPPHRGKICLPEYILDTAECLSEARKISSEELWKITYLNLKKFYNL